MNGMVNKMSETERRNEVMNGNSINTNKEDRFEFKDKQNMECE